MSLLDNAIKFAVNAHIGQVDKAGKPYILHPLAVMLDSAMDTEEKRVVAVLHDTLEDSVTLFPDLAAIGLDKNLIRSLDCLTHHEWEPLEQYYQRILSDPTGIAREVKLADIRHNTSSARMECLTLAEQERLKEKYKSALKILNKE